MKSLKGTITCDNLAKAFAGESQARNRYTFYEEVAKKEGHEYVASIFKETGDNERAHAKIFFDLLVEGLGKSEINVSTQYPVGFSVTLENLQYAAEGEKEEWENAYPEFAQKAKEEGFREVENAFNKIVKIEKHHEERFLALRQRLEENRLYKMPTQQKWICKNCGYIHEGTEAPGICPTCKYPQGYFEIMNENLE